MVPATVSRVRREYAVKTGRDLPRRPLRVRKNQPSLVLAPGGELEPEELAHPPIGTTRAFKDWLLDQGIIVDAPEYHAAAFRLFGLMKDGRAIVLCNSVEVDGLYAAIGASSGTGSPELRPLAISQSSPWIRTVDRNLPNLRVGHAVRRGVHDTAGTRQGHSRNLQRSSSCHARRVSKRSLTRSGNWLFKVKNVVERDPEGWLVPDRDGWTRIGDEIYHARQYAKRLIEIERKRRCGGVEDVLEQHRPGWKALKAEYAAANEAYQDAESPEDRKAAKERLAKAKAEYQPEKKRLYEHGAVKSDLETVDAEAHVADKEAGYTKKCVGDVPAG